MEEAEKRHLTQQKTLLRWVNSKIRQPLQHIDQLCGYPGRSSIPLVELVCALWDGFDQSLADNKKSNAQLNRIHRVEKTVQIMDVLVEKGLIWQRFDAAKLVDGDSKSICNLLFTLVMELANVELANLEKSQSIAHAKKRDFLVHWCHQCTSKHRITNVIDLSSSWSKGNAIYAMFDHLKPRVIDYEEMLETKLPEARAENLDYVLDLFTEFFHVPRLIDAEDLMVDRPDERSVTTLVVELFNSVQDIRDREKVIAEKEVLGGNDGFRVFVDSMLQIVEMRTEVEASFTKLQDSVDVLLENLASEKAASKRALATGLKLDTIGKSSDLKSRLKTVGLLSGCEDIFKEILEIVKEETYKLEAPEVKQNDFEKLLKLCEDRFTRLLHGTTADVEIYLDEDLLEHLQLITKMSEDLKKISNFSRMANSAANGWDDSCEYRLGSLKRNIQDRLVFIQKEIRTRDRLANLGSKKVDKLAAEMGNLNLEELDYVFNKFDTGSKGYLNKSDTRKAITFMYSEVNVSAIEKAFEASLAQTGRVLRGLYFDEFVHLSKTFGDDESDDNDTDDVLSLSNFGILSLFKEVSNDSNTVKICDLETKYGHDVAEKLKVLMLTSIDEKSLEYAIFFNGGFKNIVTPKELFMAAR
ncbi:unnamed protein product [Kuraishia capsulata CBS 1993]|uniref:EF-hand domain-containing protein n=1 Tax=Kuraishia capsulata CBS 1993 TaxID=1382522 RepID=W6MQR4_9ASCO|nr:uncharacterized protein KUCA_T00003581001 [Kuraishia capsulata CBS 1993]CDK27602.1 unnamed protein product [Kuraishia capsulata CBS 1993]